MKASVYFTLFDEFEVILSGKFRTSSTSVTSNANNDVDTPGSTYEGRISFQLKDTRKYYSCIVVYNIKPKDYRIQ